MIVVRDVFRLKFGKAKEALALMKPVVDRMNSVAGDGKFRLMTDLVGDYYTLVMESTVESIDKYFEYDDSTPEDEWKVIYAKFSELVINGYRDIWTVVA